MSSPHDPAQRLVDLELLLTHLQHDVEQLNAVVIAQQQELERLQRSLGKLQDRFDQSAEPEPRDPLQERPPHY
jgi:SlyX protein